MKLTNKNLSELYLEEKLSVSQISKKLNVSQGRVNYWLNKFEIKKRSISDATYQRLNPEGDPFQVQEMKTVEDSFLLGVGLGLFWGEGTKKNYGSVRLGNTDPYLVRTFLFFLRRHYKIQEHRLRFGLQIFSDMNVEAEEKFWSDFLQVPRKSFYKSIVTISGSIGNYREKSIHGVLTVYFHNKKLRDQLCGEVDKLKKMNYSNKVL